MNNKKLSLYPWVDIKELGDNAKSEAIVYNYSRGEVHRINATALEVLKLCDGKHTIDEIAEKLADIYDVNLDVLKEDVAEIIKKFAELRIVKERNF